MRLNLTIASDANSLNELVPGAFAVNVFFIGHSRSLFVYFRPFKQTLLFLQQIYVKKCPSSIWCWDSNPQPSEHESPPITTSPGLPPKHRPNVFLKENKVLTPFLTVLWQYLSLSRLYPGVKAVNELEVALASSHKLFSKFPLPPIARFEKQNFFKNCS